MEAKDRAPRGGSSTTQHRLGGAAVAAGSQPNPAIKSDSLGEYRRALKELDGQDSHLEPQKILACLVARDAVERSLEKVSRSGANAVEELASLDTGLRALAPRMARARRAIENWRRSVKPPAEAWWWVPHRVLPKWLARAEKPVEILALVLFPFSLAFAIDLAGRFGSEGGGLEGALSIIVVTALGSIRLLASGFRERLSAFLNTAGLEGRYWRPAISFLILLGLASICLLALGRPALSRYYNDRGTEALRGPERPRAQLAVARQQLERAIRFDPANPVPHYHIALVYEELFEEEKAIAEYRIAVAAGLDLARNNLGRLYLRQGEYDRAAALLRQDVADMGTKRGIEPEHRYYLLKNLGWARLGQRRFGEARSLLEEAARLLPDRAPAHCLLARTLAETGDSAGAEVEWRRCLAWANPYDPDQDLWIGEAQAAFRIAPIGKQP